MTLLQSQEVDALQRRVVTLNQDLTQLSEKQHESESREEDVKIKELYDLVIKWDLIAQQLPSIVNRLKALKTLHEEAAAFQTSLLNLETTSTELKKTIGNNATLLAKVSASRFGLSKKKREISKDSLNSKVEENMKANLSIIQNNFSIIENRIAELDKKVKEIASS